MEESQKFFEPSPVEREETLVTASDASLSTPRFDEVEAQVARPVVPLAGGFAKRGGVGSSGVRRRQWPIALVLISALAGGVVSLLAFRLYQQRQQTQAVAATAQTEGETPETNVSETSETTATTPLAQTATTQTDAQTESPVVFEEFDPAKEGVATVAGVNEAKPARKATEADAKPAAGKEDRAGEAKPAPRAAEPKPRLVETITAPRPVGARGENVSRDERRNDDDDDFFEERRERRRERRNQRREGRRGPGRNIDRIKDIFEGPPPA